MQLCIECWGMQSISEILRGLRETLSQSEIARRTGISQSKLSRWESGEIAAGADDALKLLALAKHPAPKKQATQGHKEAANGWPELAAQPKEGEASHA